MKPRKFTDAELHNARIKGLSKEEMATKFKCSVVVINRYLSKLGLLHKHILDSSIKRISQPVFKFTADDVYKLIKTGHSREDIAQHFGCSPSTVDLRVRHLRDIGLIKRNSGRPKKEIMK